LIVGAGPTGMALAISLQKAGIDHVIVDKLEQGLNTSRAGVIHAHTLEMLEELGVSRQLVEQGLKINDFCIRDRNRILLKLQFDALPSPYRHLLMLPQDITERVLSERLSDLGGYIHRGVIASRVQQDSTGVTVGIQTSTGEASIRAQYVIGADGMHSVVRQATETEFEGGTYEDSFVLADVQMEWPLANEVSLFFSPSGLLVVAPLPNGAYRVVATVAQPPERPGLDDIQGLILARGPAGRNLVKEVVWSSRFRLHHRVAQNYRNGRLILMGDAAHVHSPAGGQGMNTGLVDAVVLGKLLVRTLRGLGDVLDTYQELRHPAATQVLALAGRLTAMATMRGSTKLALRNAALSFINLLPPVRRRISMQLSGLSRRALAHLPGDKPQPPASADAVRGRPIVRKTA
jgi:2-polyprenyl-6-methoxyphenol hydroxylase-like FAD-dependent oxidoreductase